MKHFFSFFAVVLLIMSAPAMGCSQEKMGQQETSEQRAVSTFHGVKVSNGIELVLKQSGEENVTISANKSEYLPLVKTEVVEGELRIYIERENGEGWKSGNKKIKAYVVFKNLDHISGQSGTKTTIEGNLTAKDLAITLGSGSSINGKLEVTNLDMAQGQGSMSTLKGKTEKLNISVTSGSGFNGYDLSADNVTASAGSGGEIELQVNKTLTASASSGASILYKGGGTLENTATSSGGSVKKAS